jgi:hypothetical protein
MRSSTWRSGICLFLLLFLPMVLLSVGCRKAPRKQGALSIPTNGNVRIVSREIENTASRRHWKWSVIGERNWRKAEVSGTAASLTSTYPLNDTTERGGCNIWETDLTVADGRWTLVLHGSDGTTAQAEGMLSVKGSDLSQTVEIRQEDDRLISLPADLALATVDGKPVTLRIER